MAQDNLNDETVNINIPGTMLAQIDAQVGAGFVDREEFIRSATRYYLDHLREANDTKNSLIG